MEQQTGNREQGTENRPYRNRQPRWRRAARTALNRQLKAQGTPPRLRQWIVSVEPERIPVPAWARRLGVQGLGQTSSRIWLWPVDADRLAAEDRAAGGEPTLRRAEFRRCPVCARGLIGTDAEHRRALDAGSPEGRQTPCGPNCLTDRASGLWKRLAPGARTVKQGTVKQGIGSRE